MTRHMSQQDPTVFVVDDDPSVLRSLGRMFEVEGYAVERFAHPRQMLALPPWTGPGCVVLDLRMPELNGLELQEALPVSYTHLTLPTNREVED